MLMVSRRFPYGIAVAPRGAVPTAPSRARLPQKSKPDRPMDSFRVGQCHVSPSLNRIVRRGTTVHVEPRVMHLLCRLAESEGEVLSRAALLAAVWPGRVVEDETLSSAVAKLRRALGDRARGPSYVETVPKRTFGPPPSREEFEAKGRVMWEVTNNS